MGTWARAKAFNTGSPAPQYVLRFPSNTTTSPRIILTSTNLLPFSPAAYIWEVTPVQQTGYYTTFFWGNNDGSFNAGQTYCGFHPYPQGGASGTVHNWEISANGQDIIVDDNGNSTVVVKGVKYTQAATVEVVGSDYVMKYYWNLPDLTKVISYTFPTGNYTAPPSPVLTLGGNAWAPSGENLSGDFRRFKAFTAILSTTDISAESADLTRLVTSAGYANIWLGISNWTSTSDLTCDYGTGRSFAWSDGGNRATLVAL